MKKLYSLAAIGILACCFIALKRNSGQKIIITHLEPIHEKEKSENDGIDKAMLQEIARTKDPGTGTVPTERLRIAEQIQTELFKSQLANGFFSPVTGISWTERGPDNIGGRTRAMMFDIGDITNKKVFVGGVGGGIWSTTDITAATPAWTKFSDTGNLAVTCITQHPFTDSSYIMFFGTGEGWFNFDAIKGRGIYKSINAGATWTILPSTIPTSTDSTFAYVEDIKYVCCGVGPALVASTRYGGIQRSEDKGATWTKVLGNGVGGGTTDRAADLEFVYNYIYATMGIFGSGGIYRSGNGGQTWVQIYAPALGEQRIEVASNPNAYYQLWALVHKSETDGTDPIGRIMKASNADTLPGLATRWVNKPLPTWCDNGTTSSDFTRSQAWYDLIVQPDPVDTSVCYIGGVDLFKTTNNGAAWTQLSQWGGGCGKPYVHADIHEILVRPGYSFGGPVQDLLIGTDGGIFRTTNAGTSFIELNKSYNVTQYYGVAIHPVTTDYFLAGAQDNGTQKFTNSGMNTATTVTGGDGGYPHIDQTDNGMVQITSFVENNYNVSTDGGNNFTDYGFTGGSFINPTAFDNISNILYGGNAAGSFFRWIDPALPGSAAGLSVPDFAGANVTHVSVSPVTGNRVYFGLDNGSVVRIDNAHGGSPTSTIIKTGGSPNGSVSCIVIDATDENHMLITYSNYGIVSVLESLNANTVSPSWANVEGNLPDMPVRWAMFDPRNNDWAILATERGIWSTTNLAVGANWQPTNTNFANTRVDMLAYRSSDRLLVAATHGRGLFSANIPAALPVKLNDFTGRIQKNDVVLNWSTALEQNSRAFEIERSFDGSEFKKIGSVEAAGNSSIKKSYSFIDPAISQENNYYRLKQIDLDGKHDYSKIILIKNPVKGNEPVKLLTNPAINKIDVQFGKIQKGRGTLDLFDNSGRLVMRSAFVVSPNSRYRTYLPSNIPSGIYSVRIIIGNLKYAAKVRIN